MPLLFLGQDLTQFDPHGYDESRRGGVAIPDTSHMSPGEHVRIWCTFFIVAMFVSLPSSIRPRMKRAVLKECWVLPCAGKIHRAVHASGWPPGNHGVCLSLPLWPWRLRNLALNSCPYCWHSFNKYACSIPQVYDYWHSCRALCPQSGRVAGHLEPSIHQHVCSGLHYNVGRRRARNERTQTHPEKYCCLHNMHFRPLVRRVCRNGVGAEWHVPARAAHGREKRQLQNGACIGASAFLLVFILVDPYLLVMYLSFLSAYHVSLCFASCFQQR